MNQIHIQYFQTCIGKMISGSFDNQLCLLDFRDRHLRTNVDNRLKNGFSADFIEQDDVILEQTRTEVEEYLEKKREVFDLPIVMVGTPFQKKVWNALLQVPYGTTLSYLQLARTIGNKKAVRAVAGANAANAIGLIIPCHRIIAADGSLGGYAGGIAIKKQLLQLEE